MTTQNIQSTINENCQPLLETQPTYSKNNPNPNKEQTILDKWLLLQKTIKEEISLEETIIQQLEVNHKKLIDNYYTYYKEKINLRKISENILEIDKGTKKQFTFEIQNMEETEKKLLDIFNPVQNLLFHLRNNYCYIEEIADIIDSEKLCENPQLSKQIDSLIELFCHQSFENILIPNPEKEELLLLVYLLLKKEIEQMNYISPCGFLEQNSFLSKFLESFTKKQELKSYLSVTFGKLILDIDDMDKKTVFFDSSETDYEEEINEKKQKLKNKRKKNENEFTQEIEFLRNEDILTHQIPKSTINFNKKIELIDEDLFQIQNTEKSTQNIDNIKTENLQQNLISENSKLKIQYNDLYKHKINHELLIYLINNETDPNLQNFYKEQLKQVSKNEDIFTTKKLIESIKESNNPEQKFLKYRKSFLYIQDKIEQIMQILFDKITNFPYTFRCICKIIYLLISKKFPQINTFEKNAIIGEFLLGKCILPILINSEINTVVTSSILNDNTRYCLKIVAKVLTQISRSSLFDINVDPDFTIFNHYIIEVLPKLNEFYSRIIDVPMPEHLNEVIEKYLNENIVSNFKVEKTKFLFSLLNEHYENQKSSLIEYDYFKYNPEESINMQCICFHMSDVLFLTKLLKNNIERFKEFPNYKFFQKTISRLVNAEYKMIAMLQEEIEIDKVKEQNNKEIVQSQNFFLVYKEFQNPQFALKKEAKSLILNKKELFIPIKDEQTKKENTLRQIKFCIKTVLKRLNTLNLKDFPYLNLVDSNYRFFLALKYTLNDLDDFSEFEPNSIPLKWYGQFITNNRINLQNDYIINDHNALFNEIFDEEKKLLELLKDRSTSIFAKNGMNIRCAEKLIEKEQMNVFRINKVKTCMEIQKFIFSNQGPKVCIRFQKEDDKINTDDKKSKISSFIPYFKTNSKNSIPEKEPSSNFINIEPIETCVHTKLLRIQGFSVDKNDNNELLKKNDKGKHHAINIDKFIYQINKYFKECAEQTDGKYINESFYKHSSKTINSYMKFVKSEIQKDLSFKDKNLLEKANILETIENFIQKRIFKSVFTDKIKENEDKQFYEKTLKLSSEIKPEDLGLNELLVHELDFAISSIQNIDKGKSAFEKLEYVSYAFRTINNNLKFSLGQDKEIGADDISPIFHYIVIKATPKHYFSNIFFIQTLISDSNVLGHYEYLLSQLEFAGNFVNDYFSKKKLE